ncbi:unnamed protein product [Didymodactylos carnosus]|uniref:Uncharacterized protein n=1 Tax=Didymodactylos carnosus TaxID=1234261 RepID=A0A8S2PTK0_9BILA|nr:unnamed protein product [Didymodactylos carnosus]CAF4069447.1 unnamed protein product [Didymodactylos carnosus]
MVRSESSVLIITNGLAAKSILLDRTLYSRQKPNAWMIKTVLIINPFTVSNNEYRKEFVASVFKILSELYKPDNYKCFVEIVGLSDLDEEIGNALNIVIPGYETMWRVVFYTLLELIRRPILFNELRNSTSVELLIPCVKETLRLYPPTKSIYRQNIQSGQEIRIAIDQIHRDIGVWGLDANTFNPDRFKADLTPDQKNYYLPFADICPARHRYAYLFSTTVIGTFIQKCNNIQIHCGCLPLTEYLLILGRNAYSDMEVTVS